MPIKTSLQKICENAHSDGRAAPLHAFGYEKAAMQKQPGDVADCNPPGKTVSPPIKVNDREIKMREVVVAGGAAPIKYFLPQPVAPDPKAILPTKDAYHKLQEVITAGGVAPIQPKYASVGAEKLLGQVERKGQLKQPAAGPPGQEGRDPKRHGAEAPAQKARVIDLLLNESYASGDFLMTKWKAVDPRGFETDLYGAEALEYTRRAEDAGAVAQATYYVEMAKHDRINRENQLKEEIELAGKEEWKKRKNEKPPASSMPTRPPEKEAPLLMDETKKNSMEAAKMARTSEPPTRVPQTESQMAEMRTKEDEQRLHQQQQGAKRGRLSGLVAKATDKAKSAKAAISEFLEGK